MNAAPCTILQHIGSKVQNMLLFRVAALYRRAEPIIPSVFELLSEFLWFDALCSLHTTKPIIANLCIYANRLKAALCDVSALLDCIFIVGLGVSHI